MTERETLDAYFSDAEDREELNKLGLTEEELDKLDIALSWYEASLVAIGTIRYRQVDENPQHRENRPSDSIIEDIMSTIRDNADDLVGDFWAEGSLRISYKGDVREKKGETRI